MKSITQVHQKLASVAVRGKADPKSKTGGVRRNSWAFHPRRNPPSVVREIPVEQYLNA